MDAEEKTKAENCGRGEEETPRTSEKASAKENAPEPEKTEKTGIKTKDGRKAGYAAREISYAAMFVAILSVCAWISFPIGEIPITLQTMGVCFAAALLGWKRGFFAIVAYLLLGFCGVPVFSGFTGGAAKLVSPTGGYLVGFVFTALIVGFASDRCRVKNIWVRTGILVLAMAAGIAVCYVFGTVWFMFVYNAGAESPTSFAAALATCVFPYLPFEPIKIAVAALLAARLKKYMKI